MKVGREKFTVYQSHLQPNGFLSIPAMASFMQEAAWVNVKEIGVSTESLFEQGLAWVLTKMHWKILDKAGHRDTIIVETWPSGSDKYFFYRDFRLYSEEKLIAKITTSWILISLQSRQLRPVPDFLSKLTFTHQTEPMPRATAKIKLPKNFEHTQQQHISWHHLDVNKHTNNTFYLQWLLDALPIELLSKKSLKILDIAFKTESKKGEKLIVKTAATEEKKFLQGIFNKDGKELVRASSEWT